MLFDGPMHGCAFSRAHILPARSGMRVFVYDDPKQLKRPSSSTEARLRQCAAAEWVMSSSLLLSEKR